MQIKSAVWMYMNSADQSAGSIMLAQFDAQRHASSEEKVLEGLGFLSVDEAEAIEDKVDGYSALRLGSVDFAGSKYIVRRTFIELDPANSITTYSITRYPFDYR